MTRISVVLSLLCVLCSITSSYAFVYEDCGSELASFSEMTISSCDVSEEKCTLPRGKDIYVNLKFTPKTDISNLISYGYGILVDVPIPFPLEKPEVCKNPDSGISCPVKKDEVAEYKASFFIDKKIPTLSLDVMWQFKTDKDEKVICVKFPVKIV